MTRTMTRTMLTIHLKEVQIPAAFGHERVPPPTLN